jgi:hypothetical protein
VEKNIVTCRDHSQYFSTLLEVTRLEVDSWQLPSVPLFHGVELRTLYYLKRALHFALRKQSEHSAVTYYIKKTYLLHLASRLSSKKQPGGRSIHRAEKD